MAACPAIHSDPDQDDNDSQANERTTQVEEAARLLLSTPAACPWMAWWKWRIMELWMEGKSIGGRVDNRIAFALGCIKADLMRFGVGDDSQCVAGALRAPCIDRPPDTAPAAVSLRRLATSGRLDGPSGQSSNGGGDSRRRRPLTAPHVRPVNMRHFGRRTSHKCWPEPAKSRLEQWRRPGT